MVLVDWFVKQWQRVNLTYIFIRVPIDIIKLLLWLFILFELSDIFPLTIENMVLMMVLAFLILLTLGYIFERTKVFYKYQGQIDKIQTADRDIHRWRISGAYVARGILIGRGEDTTRIDALIDREKDWFFPRGRTEGAEEEFNSGLE